MSLDELTRGLMVRYGVPLPQPMRYIPHHPTERQNLFVTIDEILEAFYGGAAGGGKALKTNELLATPTGWTTMGEVQVGDYVIAADGRPTRVVACSEVHFEDTYEVEFSDGSVIVAGANHRWVTSTLGERARVLRGTDAWREKRRAKRPSRQGMRAPGAWAKSSGNKSERFTAQLIARNKQRPPARKEVPTSGVRTTAAIAASVTVHKRINHSVAVAAPLQLPEADLLIDPYVLGAWLGDGASRGGQIAGIDEEVFQQVANAGYTVTVYPSSRYSRGVLGLQTELKQLGVFGNKHIPAAYLRASHAQRLALLQGVMDTDGYCDQTGQCEITLTRKQLAENVTELILSLGAKCTMRESAAKLDGRYMGPRYRMKFMLADPAFRLPRKLVRQKRAGFRGGERRRYIVAVRPAERVPLRCIQVDAPSHCYLAGRSMIPTHNSDALLMDALRFVDFPGYSAIIFRRTLEELKLAEALLERAREWLSKTPAKWNATEMKFTFPAGSTLQFGYLANDRDTDRYQSAAFQRIYFDELSHFEERHYRYLFSRLRRLKTANVPLAMRSAGNPGGRGQLWVKRRFIPDGFRPVDAEDVRVHTKEIIYDDEERQLLSTLLEGQPLPTHRAFVPARMQDNPHLDKATYAMSLYQLDKVTREQMLKGDWSIYVVGRQRFNAARLGQYVAVKPATGELQTATDQFGRMRNPFVPTETGIVSVWQKPQPGRVYVMGSDTATGRDSSEDDAVSDPDFSATDVFDAMSGKQVASIRGRINEAEFGTYNFILACWYNNAFIAPDVTGGYGRAMLNKLLDLGYPRELIFNRYMLHQLAGQPPHRGEVASEDLGFTISPTTRPLLISLLDDAINTRSIEIYDAMGLDELFHFCHANTNPSPRAEAGWHDDTVFAKALAVVAIQVAPLAAMLKDQRKEPAIVRYALTGQPVDDRQPSRVDEWIRRG